MLCEGVCGKASVQHHHGLTTIPHSHLSQPSFSWQVDYSFHKQLSGTKEKQLGHGWQWVHCPWRSNAVQRSKQHNNTTRTAAARATHTPRGEIVQRFGCAHRGSCATPKDGYVCCLLASMWHSVVCDARPPLRILCTDVTAVVNHTCQKTSTGDCLRRARIS